MYKYDQLIFWFIQKASCLELISQLLLSWVLQPVTWIEHEQRISIIMILVKVTPWTTPRYPSVQAGSVFGRKTGDFGPSIIRLMTGPRRWLMDVYIADVRNLFTEDPGRSLRSSSRLPRICICRWWKICWCTWSGEQALGQGYGLSLPCIFDLVQKNTFDFFPKTGLDLNIFSVVFLSHILTKLPWQGASGQCLLQDQFGDGCRS